MGAIDSEAGATPAPRPHVEQCAIESHAPVMKTHAGPQRVEPKREMEIMTGTRFPRYTLIGGAALALLVVLPPPARANFLTYVQTLEPGVGGVTGITSSNGAAVSPDGRHVYVAGNTDDAVATFGRNPANGALTWLGVQQNGVNGAIALASASRARTSPTTASPRSTSGLGGRAKP